MLALALAGHAVVRGTERRGARNADHIFIEHAADRAFCTVGDDQRRALDALDEKPCVDAHRPRDLAGDRRAVIQKFALQKA